ncbi:MAG: ABC transporter permease [Chloroflexi bacterium AL-N10]|nr:ABC transporter permease [Chloroflexi bacterium AL-N1]NOK68987.1 ABC transporter permease [Chloroflexi bacterium AL-N10]NOK76970.1 ABC transporter permease [Chloroflexi bacterium AL-N5]NOK90827.1 ABC transporter permease [Chloroflexi bacterium AL-N15]
MTTSAQPIQSTSDTILSRKPRSLWGDAWRRLISNRAAVGGMIIIVLLILVAIFAPVLTPHNPVVQESGNSLRQPFWVTDATASTAPLPEHPLGTDGLGRDQLSRLIYATRVSIIVGLIPTIIVICIGVPIGLIAGYAGGRVDNLLMRITDIVYAFPDLLFIISISVALRETWLGQTFNGLLLIFMALAIVGWTGLARLVRGQVLSLKEKEFIEAARALGIPTRQIILKHILPNTLAPIIVAVSFAIPGAILAEATLTFLGAGMRPSVDPSNPFPTSWGVMLQEGISRLSSGPWMLLFPASCIAIVMLAFTFIGDGLRDALDPRDQ